MWRNATELAAQKPCPPKEAREVYANLAKKAKARFYAGENFSPVAIHFIERMGGKVVIRTHGTFTRTPDFESGESGADSSVAEALALPISA